MFSIHVFNEKDIVEMYEPKYLLVNGDWHKAVYELLKILRFEFPICEEKQVEDTPEGRMKLNKVSVSEKKLRKFLLEWIQNDYKDCENECENIQSFFNLKYSENNILQLWITDWHDCYYAEIRNILL